MIVNVLLLVYNILLHILVKVSFKFNKFLTLSFTGYRVGLDYIMIHSKLKPPIIFIIFIIYTVNSVFTVLNWLFITYLHMLLLFFMFHSYDEKRLINAFTKLSLSCIFVIGMGYVPYLFKCFLTILYFIFPFFVALSKFMHNNPKNKNYLLVLSESYITLSYHNMGNIKIQIDSLIDFFKSNLK